MNTFKTIYEAIDTNVIRYRYNRYARIMPYLDGLCQRFKPFNCQKIDLGTSVLGNKISAFRLGDNGKKILIWSQMHGNESTMTRALFLFLESLIVDLNQLNVQLYIIPILNPDGNDEWVRNNANDIDLNRDALQLSQPESNLLRDVYSAFQPDYCFNLHDQRSIYGTPNGECSIPISFLSPAGDQERSITIARMEAMKVINAMTKAITQSSPLMVGCYDDTYNPNCVGDYFMTQGTPTILFEAGQYGQNYNRDDIVIQMANALDVAIDSIINTSKLELESDVVDYYKSIPKIATSYCDILIKNYPVFDKRVELGVMYKEVVKDDKLHYVPLLTSVNDLNVKNGHRVIDCAGYEAKDLKISISKNQIFTSELLDIYVFC